MEDLWAFNEEIVARAIFECSVPIISAVGHETDVTIADYVADLRAPTPSAAAELAVFDIREVQAKFLTMQMELNRRMSEKLERCREMLEQFQRNFQWASPANQVNEKRQMAADFAERLELLMQQRLTAAKHELEVFAGKLDALSPARKLSQGYAFISDEDGRGVRDVDRLNVGDYLNIHMRNGRAKVEVLDLWRDMT